MFAVVVLRSNPSEHCVVPEKYIYGFEDMEAELKTWGANRCHDHLVYWSRELLNDNVVPSVDNNPPNFNLPKCNDYPPQIAACCYLARVKRFFRSFEKAKEFRDRFRPVLPVVYNAGRLNEQPAPPNDVNQENFDEENGIFEPIENENGNNQQQNNHEENQIDEDAIETKFVLPMVQLNDSDNIALDNLFNADVNVFPAQPIAPLVAQPVANTVDDVSFESAQSELDQEDPLGGDESDSGATAEDNTVQKTLEDGRVEVTKMFGDGMVMKYILHEEIRVPVDSMIKANDLLSGNLPFRQNVSVSFHFTVI